MVDRKLESIKSKTELFFLQLDPAADNFKDFFIWLTFDDLQKPRLTTTLVSQWTRNPFYCVRVDFPEIASAKSPRCLA